MGTDDLFHKRKKLKERKAGNRKPKAGSHLIVTEGKQTEPNYFEGLAKSVREACSGGRITHICSSCQTVCGLAT